jgi:hypothetical protein
MNRSEAPGDTMPQSLVEDFLAQEAGVEALLDELEKLVAEGRYEDVRARIRNFADASPGAFFAVALSLSGSSQFFADVEAQLDAAAAATLRELADDHAALEAEFGIVRTEEATDRNHPITGMSADTDFRPESDRPMVSYRPQSGDLDLYEGRAPPSDLVEIASLYLRTTADALDVISDVDSVVAVDEVNALRDRREHLEQELARLDEQIEALEQPPFEDS